MTHVFIDPNAVDFTAFARPQYGGGGGGDDNDGNNNDNNNKHAKQYFTGQKYMRGFGVFQNIAKFLTPVARNFAQSLGNEGITAGTNILKDLTEGRKSLKDSLEEHAKQGFSNLAQKIHQCGKGKRKSKKKPQRHRLQFAQYPPVVESEKLNMGIMPGTKASDTFTQRRKRGGRRKDQLDL